jgi:hypothetical protein
MTSMGRLLANIKIGNTIALRRFSQAAETAAILSVCTAFPEFACNKQQAPFACLSGTFAMMMATDWSIQHA